jgi:hypothetical protein
MGADHPERWARKHAGKLDDLTAPAMLARFTRCRDVCLPGVPLAAVVGFAMNGDEWNTTGWKVGDQAERDAAVAKGRFPFKKKDPRDASVYGAVTRTGDLHEIWWFGTEAGKTPTPVATAPDCPAVTLADDPEVVKILGRRASTGAGWYDDEDGNAAVGFANLRRHWRQARAALAPSLRWDEDDKRATLWRWCCTQARWSAGGRGIGHINDYATELAALPEAQRWGRFMQLAGAEDDAGSRHRQDEYTALRTAQKLEGARLAVGRIPSESWARAWLDDGLTDVERAAVYARLVEVSG